MHSDKINDYINSHPQESLRFLAIGLFLIWQTMPAIAGLLLYLLLIHLIKLNRWIIFISGTAIVIVAMLFQQYYSADSINLVAFIKQGFKLNVTFWRYLCTGHSEQAIHFLFLKEFNYLIGLPIFIW